MSTLDSTRAMRRGVWAIVLSLLVHLVPAIVLSSLSLLERLLPAPPVTWEIVPAQRATPPPLVSPGLAPPPPMPTQAEPTSQPERPRNTDKGGRIGKPAPPKSPPLRSLHGIGAESIEQDLGLRLVLRMGEVARSPHRQAVVGLLGAFPDSRLLVAGSSVPSGEALAEALVSSAEILVIATTDPSGQRRSQTALVAVGQKLRALYDQITARRVPTWDDRELLFDNPDLLAFLPRPVELAVPPAGSDALPPDARTPPPSPPSLTAQLPLLRRSLPKTGPPLVAEIFNVQQRLRLRGGLPTPRLVQLSLSADTDPQVHGRLVLGSAAEAGQLRDAILAIGDKLRGDWRFKLMGISTLVDHLLFEIKDSDLLVKGFVSGATLRSLLGLATGALQIIPSGAPPPPPDLLTPPPSDGGVDAH